MDAVDLLEKVERLLSKGETVVARLGRSCFLHSCSEVHREHLAVFIVNARREDIRFGLQGPQGFLGGCLVIEAKRGRAVGADNIGHHLRIAPQDLLRARNLEKENSSAGQHQGHAARDHDDKHHLALDRADAQPRDHFPSPFLILFASRISLELITSLAFSAASG